MKTKIITIAVIICILQFAGCNVKKEEEKELEKFRNGPLEFCEAIEKGNVKAVKTTIKKGIDVDLPAKKDEFPLFYAAGYGRPEIARLLIQAGANVNIKDSYGDTALHIAIRECNYKVAEILINSGADVNAKIQKGFFPGFRPLHTAVNGKKDIPYLVSLLISKGAEINSRDAKGKTPLQYAIMNRFSKSEQILLKHEKDPGNIQKNTRFPVLKGPYLGQKPPKNIPVKFPFDSIPQGYKLHSAPAFTADAKEVYFSAMNFSIRYSEKIFVMKMIEGTWTSPQVASFSGDFFDGSPSISRDGKYLAFSSARKLDGDGMNETRERNIWYVERMGDDWSSPRPLNFHTPGWENGSDISELGNLFFDSSDIYKIKFPPEGKHSPEKLGNAINSDATELHPCVSPDERFIVFYSSRQGHYGTEGGDLYISFKNNDGTWKQAVNLGEQFNKGHLSTSFPRLSPDGKYFFFLKLTSVPWQCEVFWVSVDALDDLNK